MAKLRFQPDAADLATAGLNKALDEGYYDHAFHLIKDFDLCSEVEGLIVHSYASLIETGRVATLEAFGRYALGHCPIPQHFLDLIEGEVALIDGRFNRASEMGQLAGRAFNDGHPLKARGYLIAGRAVQLLWDLERSFEFHREASDHAVTVSDSNDAAWGMCLAALLLERSDARETLKALETPALGGTY
jgi:hypothetical protein